MAKAIKAEIPDAYQRMNAGILCAIKYTQVESWRDVREFIRTHKWCSVDILIDLDNKIRVMEAELVKLKW